MCGRFALYSSFSAIKEYADILNEIEDLEANYNSAPGQIIPIIMLQKKKKYLKPAKWGLVPFWTNNPKIGSHLINARADSVAIKPSFKAAFKYRRCLIPANGFYEWRKNNKQPFYITLKNSELFTFAGLWEEWYHPDGTLLRTCSIITTEPNEIMQEIHDRMPVILSPKAEEKWLVQNDQKKLLDLLIPFDSKEMQMHPVSKAVNSYKNNDSQLLKEV
ncbi:MAG: SOS response-associated peptidase [Candidatus Cloacimonadales bacterium]|nr:SOS response-associated peptidase [Candidatus Cloacimonadales bacterium]